jgi:hypothetical protein
VGWPGLLLDVLHDLQAVAVLIAEREHRWDARPVQELPDVDPGGGQVAVQGSRVVGDEPVPALAAAGQAVGRPDERDRHRCADRRHLDPAGAELLQRRVQQLLGSECADAEVEGPVLIGHRDADGADAADAACGWSLTVLPVPRDADVG